MEPWYHIPGDMVIKILWAVLSGRRRDLRLDARACIRGFRPPVRILGEECIPSGGPFLLVMNHYQRPGFAVWWQALSVSARLRMPHIWIIASRWTASGRWYEPVKVGISRFLFGRLAGIYGLASMPPMPPNPQDVEARAAAVRNVLAYVESQPQAVVCMAPEGRDVSTGGLGWPPSGAGRFISLLAARGLAILPVGGWEEGGELKIHFGPLFRLERPQAGGKREELDRLIAETVMKRIARVLPEAMRGEFG